MSHEPGLKWEQGQNQMMHEWTAVTGKHYLRRMIANEAVPKDGPHCQVCKADQGLYRCRDCQHAQLQCKACLHSSHRNLPSHRVRRWNGRFFQDDSLKKAGCILDLGHDGLPCCLGQVKDFILVDVNGIHEINVRFCLHTGSGGHARQLLRARIFPASEEFPATGFTFGLLKQFSLLSAIAKVPAEAFYNVLVYQTNPCYPNQVPNRYRELMRVFRQWQHLTDLKRAGKTSLHAQSDARGNLALRCPACPRPLVNYDPALVLAGIRSVYT